MVRVSRVHSSSIAEQVGILTGTELLSVIGRELSDAESERDRTQSRMEATKSALAAAEDRLLALEQEH